MKLLILSDDFTGALDTGVQLSAKHIPTTVFVSAGTLPDTGQAEAYSPENCEVLVINTESRHLSYTEAYTRTKSLLEIYAAPDSCIYIKTDSALRGNIPAVLQAAVDVCGSPLLFIPAFPALGRTTRGAVCYIDGELLENSVFRKDPRTPAAVSSIPEIFARSESTLSLCPVSGDDRGSFNELRASKPADVYLFDCETDADMEQIASLIQNARLYRLTAGCAGFASTFASHIPLATEPPADVRCRGPVLFVSGSANAVTLAQISYAGRHGYAVCSLAETIQACYRDPASSGQAIRKAFEEAARILGSGRPLIVATAAKKDELLEIHDTSFHETVAFVTVSLVQSLIEQFTIETLSVFGGDMAAALLKQLSCPRVKALGEIAPGLPVCTFSLHERPFYLATKSGGFGEPEAILTIDRYFTGRSTVSPH